MGLYGTLWVDYVILKHKEICKDELIQYYKYNSVSSSSFNNRHTIKQKGL